VHDDAQPRGTHMAQSDPLDRRPRGGARALGRGRESLVRLFNAAVERYQGGGKWRDARNGWGHPVYDAHPGYPYEPVADDFTLAAAGCDLGDDDARTDQSAEANGAGGSDVSGHDRSGPRLLYSQPDADGNTEIVGLTFGDGGVRRADVRDAARRLVSDEDR
jgi:hypothetical protein